MAEIVYKKISELPNATLPLAGTEYVELSATGASKRGLWSGIFGSGWWDKLKASFVDFVAPEALHANDADTIGGETSADLHNAGALTGVAPLSAIPSELAGKNAATATYATSAGTATNATYATSAGTATNAASTKNESGETLPAENASNHGKFFYKIGGSNPGLYYCAQTGPSLYPIYYWLKIY